jgi:hypothetical protein
LFGRRLLGEGLLFDLPDDARERRSGCDEHRPGLARKRVDGILSL